MICQNCSSETNGIKIKGKLFCTNCGEVIHDVQDVQQADPTKTNETPTAKLIDPEGNSKKINREIAALEAEEEVLSAIAKLKPAKPKRGIKIKNSNIQKHNRPRIIGAGKNAFKVYAGEPNPVKEPELEVPHDDLLPAAPKGTPVITKPEEVRIDLGNPDEFPGHALLDKNTREEIEAKRKKASKIVFKLLKKRHNPNNESKKEKREESS